MSSASLQPSGMSEVASNVGQITGRAYLPGTSVDVLSMEKIEGVEDLQPSCLQFSPTSRKHLVVGTYSLGNPATQSRKGSLLLYRLHDEKLVLLDNFVHSSGIFDIKFNDPKYHGAEKFAVASSTGSISMFKLEVTINPGHGGMVGKIVHLNTFQVFPESAVITSLAWHSSDNGPIAVSQANGQVSVLTFDDEYTVLHSSAVINNHDGNEAWAVVFGMHIYHLHADDDDNSTMMAEFPPLSQNQVQRFKPAFQALYSGGDDSRLRFSLFFRDEEGHAVSRQYASNRHGGSKGLGGHSAGVTAILPLPFKTTMGEEILITGSYDDHVRVYAMYDRRPSATDNKPKVLTELNIGGGVWRLAFLEDYTKNDLMEVIMYFKGDSQPIIFRVLACCMQGGVRILEVTGCLKGDWTIDIIADLKFNTPNDLVYAGDVQPAGPDTPEDGMADDADRNAYVIVSANFYERQLCVWKYRTSVTPVLSPKTKYLNDRVAMYGQDESTRGGRYCYNGQ